MIGTFPIQIFVIKIQTLDNFSRRLCSKIIYVQYFTISYLYNTELTSEFSRRPRVIFPPFFLKIRSGSARETYCGTFCKTNFSQNQRNVNCDLITRKISRNNLISLKPVSVYLFSISSAWIIVTKYRMYLNKKNYVSTSWIELMD